MNEIILTCPARLAVSYNAITNHELPFAGSYLALAVCDYNIQYYCWFDFGFNVSSIIISGFIFKRQHSSAALCALRIPHSQRVSYHYNSATYKLTYNVYLVFYSKNSGSAGFNLIRVDVYQYFLFKTEILIWI